MRARALLTEPLPALAAEAAWRTLRSTRKAAFRLASLGDACPVRFHPIGYYQLQKESVSAHARESILAYADAILAGEYPLLGYGSPSLGTQPNWQADWVSGKSWPLKASRNLRIVRHDGSDVKAPWELSRLQWSPVVAKAWVLTGDQRYRAVLRSLLTDWIANNPVGKGVNWTIAMEAALRGISLSLTMELLWPFAEAEKPWLDLLEKSLWQHLRFIEAHSEFSWLVRSNHYLSNLIGLTTLSAYLQGTAMKSRRATYARAVQREVMLQTYADGGDREASTGYHVLVAQMALHSLIVQQRVACTPAPAFEARLRRMFEWIKTLADEEWTLPLLGDCDNGRVELLVDDIAQSGLAPCHRHALRVGGLAGLAFHTLGLTSGGDPQDAAWFGYTALARARNRNLDPLSTLPDSGLAVLRTADASVIFSAMPNGLSGKGSHTHCDKLSFILRLHAKGETNGGKAGCPISRSFLARCGPSSKRSADPTHELIGSTELAEIKHHEVFCDTGTRCYTRSADLRNFDRSTRAHNTLSVDQADQNKISLQLDSIFRSGNEATVSPITPLTGEQTTVQASHQGYARYGIAHRRTLQLRESTLHLTDEVTERTPGQKRLLDLHFTLGPEWTVSSKMMTGDPVSCVILGPRQVTLACTAASHLTLDISPAQISREYGTALPGTSIRIRTTTSLPATVRTTVDWN